ncbi:uncharacterized protein ASCRUDRAFT_68052 [Ascoidea rubescens DSM 1968]|uniref:Uncharacterized protein n=1 Tax=Ascoidea rubescens DSM 1968 TaxID=1344418 RepID=A0A1D2VQZ1_9ASCO|nr:hypothetical protein ASCRUDRAFT_68052 [Ascoidea rubescens DSM 1968]ODV64008.1 hypothetical protein ASCRUDRAFT_68052 [Ascoidea rubescens DSM 1968]
MSNRPRRLTVKPSTRKQRASLVASSFSSFLNKNSFELSDSSLDELIHSNYYDDDPMLLLKPSPLKPKISRHRSPLSKQRSNTILNSFLETSSHSPFKFHKFNNLNKSYSEKDGANKANDEVSEPVDENTFEDRETTHKSNPVDSSHLDISADTTTLNNRRVKESVNTIIIPLRDDDNTTPMTYNNGNTPDPVKNSNSLKIKTRKPTPAKLVKFSNVDQFSKDLTTSMINRKIQDITDTLQSMSSPIANDKKSNGAPNKTGITVINSNDLVNSILELVNSEINASIISNLTENSYKSINEYKTPSPPVMRSFERTPPHNQIDIDLNQKKNSLPKPKNALYPKILKQIPLLKETFKDTKHNDSNKHTKELRNLSIIEAQTQKRQNKNRHNTAFEIN